MDSPAARDTPCHDVELEVAGFQSKDLCRATAPQQCADAGEELRQCKRLDEIIVSTQVEAEYSVLDSVSGGQDQDWRLDRAFAERLQDLEAVAAREHEVQQHQIEALGVRPKKAVLARRRQDDFVVFGFQG
jgi:hypothetical protein